MEAQTTAPRPLIGPLPPLPARTAALPWPQRLLASGSLIDSAELPPAAWDPRVLTGLSRADRVGEIRSRGVELVEDLNALALDAPAALLAPGSARGRELGLRLRRAVERRCPLWLAIVSPDALPRLERLLGPGLLTVAGHPDEGGGVPVALSPLELVRAWSKDPSRSAFLRRALAGADSLRTPGALVAALRGAGVQIRERSRLARLAITPKALAYLLVFVYSCVRALPVALVPGFTGSVWVLWSIDVLTAIPYTWGILAMVAGRRALTRILGLLVALLTFGAPYLYFGLHGKDCPPGALAVIIAMILGGIGLEVLRYLRDRLVSRELTRL